MPFSGTVTFAVTAGDRSTTVDIPVTSGSTAGVQDFDSADTLSVDYVSGGLASRSTAVKLGETGGAAALKADNGQQYSQGNIYSTIDVSDVDTLYYWLYFDSTTFVSTREGYDQDNLPEIVDRVIAHTGLENWSRESLSHVPLAWDTWIPMRATKNAGNTETNVLRVRFHNME